MLTSATSARVRSTTDSEVTCTARESLLSPERSYSESIDSACSDAVSDAFNETQGSSVAAEGTTGTTVELDQANNGGATNE